MISVRKLFVSVSVFCFLLASWPQSGFTGVSAPLSNNESARVAIKGTGDSGYKLFVDGKPFLVKGVVYHPVVPGKDYSYNFWADLNRVSKDAGLMKKAGFNTVRFYQPSEDLEQTKKVIEAFYQKGIYTVMGSWLGFWNYPCPFYGNKSFQQKTKQEVLDMVEALKDEPGILIWDLGNENNYSFSGKVNAWNCPETDAIDNPSEKINKKAEIYYSFVNDLAKSIKGIDKKHPVALGNGELIALDSAQKYAPDVDLLALIFYRGKRFGNIFNSVRRIFDKPVLISEMGCDAYNAYRRKEDQDIQAEFLLSQWTDIYKNTSFYSSKGNCLGGIIFEWSDEWWKHNEADSSHWGYHDTLGGWSNGSYYFDIKAPRNLNMNEEWFGLVSFEKSKDGKFIEKPRKAYYLLKEFFSDPKEFLDND